MFAIVLALLAVSRVLLLVALAQTVLALLLAIVGRSGRPSASSHGWTRREPNPAEAGPSTRTGA
jgi:hypothetical protein